MEHDDHISIRVVCGIIITGIKTDGIAIQGLVPRCGKASRPKIGYSLKLVVTRFEGTNSVSSMF